MASLKHFWIYILAFLALVTVVLTVAIWNSSSSPSLTSPSISKEATQTGNTLSPELTSTRPVPSDFPAPAKKLNQLINENDSQLTNTQSLDEKVQQLDKQLAEINEQLKAQGIDVPAEQRQLTPSPSDTQKRLQAIKDHINTKTNP